MSEASSLVLSGFALRTESKLIRYPNRYEDPRGQVMWKTVWDIVAEVSSDGRAHAHTHLCANAAIPVQGRTPVQSNISS